MDCDFDMPSAYVESWRKAAKDHVCGDCKGKIAKEEKYLYISGIWDDDPLSFKRCADCQHIRCEIKKDTGDDQCMALNGLFPWLQDAIKDPPWFRWAGMFNAVSILRGGRKLDTAAAREEACSASPSV